MKTKTIVRPVPKPVEQGKAKPKPKRMNERQALKMTLNLIRQEIQRLAPKANLHTLYEAAMPEAVNAADERDQWRAVQRLFEHWLEISVE